jgi:hypothetical protein
MTEEKCFHEMLIEIPVTEKSPAPSGTDNQIRFGVTKKTNHVCENERFFVGRKFIAT